MPDITTFWPPGASFGDWALDGADLAAGGDLETAVLISLFTDRRAESDDVIPGGPGEDPRGWWGDIGRRRPLGSRLWLLERAKQTEAVRLAARDYIDEALAWLVEDGIAASVEATTSWLRAEFLAATVLIVEPAGRQVQFNYQWAWKGID